ncbi:MAG: hypothetical protein ABIH08_01020 [Candidatus Omnitrophota bacterium]
MKKIKAKKRNFTLVEIVITVIVIGVIATLAIPGYSNLLEKSKAKVCAANEEVLLGAIDIYALEYDKLPGVLGQLENEHLKKSWAKIFKKGNPLQLKLAYFLVDFNKRGAAYAQEAWLYRYIGNAQYLICPADPTPPPAGCSYGLNLALADISYAQYKALPEDTVILADSDTDTFTTPAEWHEKYNVLASVDTYALGITKGKSGACKGAGCSANFNLPVGGGWNKELSPGKAHLQHGNPNPGNPHDADNPTGNPHD